MQKTTPTPPAAPTPFILSRSVSSAVLLASFALLLLAPRSAHALVRDTNVVYKDPRPFKVICYSGYRDGQAPGAAEPSEAQVREDLVMVKQFTHEIRTYGSGKGTHGNFVPKIADSVGLKVDMGIWVDATYDEATNMQAVNDAIALVNEGHKSIRSVIVGNEYMFRVRNPGSTPTPNVHPDLATSEARLINYIKVVKAAIPKTILVTSADTWSDVNANSDALLSLQDYVIWHTHPWWENQSIANAAAYADSRYKIIQARVAKIGGKPLALGETGWPTQANNGPAIGSAANQFKYFHDMQAWAWNNNSEYWAFTAFDEKWKNAEGTVGGYWGIWNDLRQPYQTITGISTLCPKYMWYENPDMVTSVLPSLKRPDAGAGSILGRPVDALGRDMQALASGKYGANHVLTPVTGARGLFIVAP